MTNATNPANNNTAIQHELRQLTRTRVAQITPEQRSALSAAVTDQLLSRPEWQRAQRILGYLPLKDELDLSPVLESALAAGKTVALPRYLPDQGAYCAALITDHFATDNFSSLSPGAFGIPEPSASAAIMPLNQLDFVLVPGVAFDASGRRLGRGKGFYDRLLANVNNADCIKCGIAADEQIVTGIPAEPHDITMDFVLTPTRWYAVRTAT
jgi:5-formyltetrahydrofolate cyclo-ligase